MRLIDADPLETRTHWECFENFDDDYEYVLKADIDHAPTVDAVELVRCRDCIHKPHTSDRYDPINGDGFEIIFPDYRCPCQCEDGYYNWMPADDWYCGNGERRQK